MVRVHGSDDLIVVEGDIVTEFYAEEETQYLVFSDGTLISLNFLGDSWRIGIATEADYHMEKASTDEVTASDIIEVEISPDWVVFGNKYERAS